jgi:hypothetical protein
MKRKTVLKKLILVLFVVLLLNLGFYSFLAKASSFKIFTNDFGSKMGRVAGVATISVHVTGAPEKPSLSGSAVCVFNSPVIELSWDQTADTDNYDIYRDNQLLVSGLITTSYDDTSVATETSYEYYVVANGPFGNTSSDKITLTTQKCSGQAAASVSILTLEGKALSLYVGTPKTTDKSPSFTGTSNIAGGNIQITIQGKTSIQASLNANLNGYWNWEAPEQMQEGTYTMTVTITDPNDVSRSATAALLFKITSKENDNGKENEKNEISQPVQVPGQPPSTPETPSQPPSENEEFNPPSTTPPSFDFDITVKNKESVVFTKESLDLEIKTGSLDGFAGTPAIHYQITDMQKNSVMDFKENYNTNSRSFVKNIFLPESLGSGKYKITVSFLLDDLIVSKEAFFTYQESPYLYFSSGLTITLSQLLGSLMWIIIFILLVLLLLLLLLLLEHHLLARSFSQVTEDDLREKGMLGNRKEVAK